MWLSYKLNMLKVSEVFYFRNFYLSYINQCLNIYKMQSKSIFKIYLSGLKFIVLLMLSPFVLTAQNGNKNLQKIDDIQIVCSYNLKYQPSAENPQMTWYDNMILQVGNNTSSFQSLYTYKQDSIRAVAKESGIKGQELITLIRQIPLPKFKYQILKNYPEGKITVLDEINRDKYLYQNAKIYLTGK